MSKVHCQSQMNPPSSATSATNSTTTSREVYTLWMKSLVLSGNGCTVYDATGSVAYRVDNYGCKGGNRNEVYLMDRTGNAVYKILRRKLALMNRGWEGYRMRCEAPEKRPSFRVQNDGGRFLKAGKSSSKLRIMVGCVGGGGTGKEGEEEAACYRVQVLKNNKSEYKIMDVAGRPIAEVQRKQTACGVVLGEDVLTLVVEEKMDRLLVMGLVVVCGLFTNTM